MEHIVAGVWSVECLHISASIFGYDVSGITLLLIIVSQGLSKSGLARRFGTYENGFEQMRNEE